MILLHWPGPQSMTGPLSTAEPAWSSSFAGQVHIPLNLNPSSSPILTTACCWASIPSFLLPKQCSREVFNYALGDVNLTSGEGLTDKCALVLAYRTLTAALPANNFFLCNVHPECILQDNRTNCQPCDKAEMEVMITLVKHLT